MKLTLPIPPSANKMYRVVNGRPIKSKDYRSWITTAGWDLVGQARGHAFALPVVISIAVPTNNLRDLDNHAKPIIDLLVLHNLIKSDRCKIVRGISMQWHDGDQVEVTVEPAAVAA